MSTNTNSPADALPIGAGDREAGHTPGSASRTLRERVAEAIRKEIFLDETGLSLAGMYGFQDAADAAIAEVMKDRPSPPLWCAHILGPDDVIPTCDYADAVELCGRINATVQQHAERNPEIGMVLCIAVPAIWPHDAASHAERAAKGNSDYGALPSPPNRGEK